MNKNEVKDMKEVFLEAASILEEVELTIEKEENGEEVSKDTMEALIGRFVVQCLKIQNITN